MDGRDLVIVVPLWKRTTNLPRLCDSVAATVPAADVLLVVAEDDREALAGADDAVDRWNARVLVVDWPGGAPGDYARKINAGYRASDRPVIFTGADDVEFLDGWYERARPALDVDYEETTSPPRGVTVGVVGLDDDCNARTATGDLSTHSLVARWYADYGASPDRSHSIYCEDYPHEYVDDELCEVAKARGAYVHVYGPTIRHHHPNVGRAELDETYLHGRSATLVSRDLFRYRKRRLWGAANPNGFTQVDR